MKLCLIEARGLHLGFLGTYGNEWVATPHLDRLAAEGIVFDQHYLDAFPRTPANDPWAPLRSAPGVAWNDIAADLASYSRQAAPSLRLLESRNGVVRIDGPDLSPPWTLPLDVLASYFDEEEEDAEPWPDPPQGEVPPDFDPARLQDTYAAAITWFDAQLGTLFDEARKRGFFDHFWWCVTASCGLPLGEHGRIGADRPWPHDELVHVPMVWRLPCGAEAGMRVAALTQPGDLAASIAEHLGLTLPPLHGKSLWPLVRGEATEIRPHAIAAFRVGAREEWLLRTSETALLVPVAQPETESRRTQMFVKPDDRWEANDVSLHRPEEMESLERVLRDAMQSASVSRDAERSAE